jgi:pimeloyl-ACP methyl ester carboxylesterase
MNMSPRFLDRPEGRIAYDLLLPTSGDGPLVVCVAGMADLRSAFRFLAPALAGAGFRVACMELRGHGDSDTTFSTYDDPAAASDLLALVEELGGPAIVVGHSMGAAAAIVAAAQRPELISGLALVGPFARDAKLNAVMRALVVLMGQPLWVRRFWKSWLPGLYAGRTPADHAAYFDQVMAALARPGHAKAFSRTLRTSHAVSEQQIGSVSAPTLVVMGELDKDFPDPAAEAGWIADQLGGEVLMVPEAGHYPHSQRADLVNPAVVEFARKVQARA